MMLCMKVIPLDKVHNETEQKAFSSVNTPSNNKNSSADETIDRTLDHEIPNDGMQYEIEASICKYSLIPSQVEYKFSVCNSIG